MFPLKDFTVRITQDIIDEAIPKESANCMIQQAMRRQHGAWSTLVDASGVRFNIGHGEEATRFRYPLPAKEIINLLLFDKDKTLVKPHVFTLRKVQGTQAPVIYRGPVGKPYAERNSSVPKGTKRKKREAIRGRRWAGLRIVEVRGKETRIEGDLPHETAYTKKKKERGRA